MFVSFIYIYIDIYRYRYDTSDAIKTLRGNVDNEVYEEEIN